jgi:membrane protease YdiL (CAAX protease family)
MQGLEFSETQMVPALMTSIIFGSVHFGNPEVSKLGILCCVYIGTGLFLGILTLMDEGMELALGFHAANNLVGFVSHFRLVSLSNTFDI